MVTLLQYSSLQSKYPSPFPSFSIFKTRDSTLISQLTEHEHQHGGNITIQFRAKKKKPNLSPWTVHAVKKDSEQFEVDPEKAKDALRKLDQQLQTLSTKQASTPKIRATDVKLTNKNLTRDEMVEVRPELSGSFLPYLTIALLTFTIFYNVLFYAVIKPSVDGPDSPPRPTTTQTESRAASVLQ